MKEQDLTKFTERMQSAAHDNLESIVLYGSAARDDFSEQYSDLNLLCLVRDAGAAALDHVAAVVEWWTTSLGHRPPLILTERELRESAEVFAIETLDIKSEHRLLAGRDVFADVEVPMDLHRVQLEHELRTTLLRLRQHYLLFAAHDDELEKALAKSVSSVVVLVRHCLIALGQAPAAGSKQQQLAQAGEVLGVDMGAVHAALDLREGRRVEGKTRDLYDRFMNVIAALTERTDQLASVQGSQPTR